MLLLVCYSCSYVFFMFFFYFLWFLGAEPNDRGTGMALAAGGAIYIFVAIAELPGVIMQEVKSMHQICVRLLAFCVGCVALGLVLLDHDHCDNNNNSSGAGGDGHNH